VSTRLVAFTATAAFAVAAVSGAAVAREIKIVGSSTVFPYTQAVAEEFANKGGQAPTVESTGTGGGMKIFCAGIGESHPDITGASRAMKSSEAELCKENGVTDVTEVLIGYDGLTVANSREGAQVDLTKEQLYKALAAKVMVDGKLVDNPYKKWSEIDPALPDVNITIYGPPPTSGTRDAFVDLVLHKACKDMGMSKKEYKANCTSMRTDGPFIESGENDNLIVQRLTSDKNAFGIFGYSFLFENQDKLQPAKVAGVAPAPETIADGSYKISRPLFFYVKNAHRKVIEGMQAFIEEYASDAAMGPGGYLSERGLVVLGDDVLKKTQEATVNGTDNAVN